MSHNASCFQYGCQPTPRSAHSLPYTGFDVGVIGCVGLLVISAGLTIRNRLDRHQ